MMTHEAEPHSIHVTHPPVTPDADPTENVKSLMAASLEALALLRVADKEISVLRSAHLREIVTLHAAHAEQLRISDLKAGDKTREVDVLASASSAEKIATAVTTLQATSDRNAETLRNQVADTATRTAKQSSDAAVATQLAMDNLFRRLDERIVLLERATSTTAGRQSVVDPQMVDFIKDMKSVLTAQSTEAGKGQGMSLIWGILLAVVAAVTSVLAIGLSVYSVMKP